MGDDETGTLAFGVVDQVARGIERGRQRVGDKNVPTHLQGLAHVHGTARLGSEDEHRVGVDLTQGLVEVIEARQLFPPVVGDRLLAQGDGFVDEGDSFEATVGREDVDQQGRAVADTDADAADDQREFRRRGRTDDAG